VVVRRERTKSEQEAIAQGVIRWEEVPFLPWYGIAYALYDDQDAS